MAKVGKRNQQGRAPREGHPASYTKIICPVCKKEYLHTAKISYKGGWKVVGLVCPNLCYFEIGSGYKVIPEPADKETTN